MPTEPETTLDKYVRQSLGTVTCDDVVARRPPPGAGVMRRGARQVSVQLDFWVSNDVSADDFGERVLCLFERISGVVTRPDGLLVIDDGGQEQTYEYQHVWQRP